jgi:hypothetical protein
MYSSADAAKQVSHSHPGIPPRKIPLDTSPTVAAHRFTCAPPPPRAVLISETVDVTSPPPEIRFSAAVARPRPQHQHPCVVTPDECPERSRNDNRAELWVHTARGVAQRRLLHLRENSEFPPKPLRKSDEGEARKSGTDASTGSKFNRRNAAVIKPGFLRRPV